MNPKRQALWLTVNGKPNTLRQHFVAAGYRLGFEDFSFHLFVECQAGSNEDSDAHRKAYSEFFVKRLRNDADRAPLLRELNERGEA